MTAREYRADSEAEGRVLANPLTLRVLAAFMERPSSAAEVARLLGLPANRVGYHVRKLERVGLLRQVAVRGRRRILAPRAEVIKVPFRFLPYADPAEAVSEILSDFGRRFSEVIAREFLDRLGRVDEEDFLVLAKGLHPTSPRGLIGEYWLTEEDLRQLADLAARIRERGPDERARRYLLALLYYPL